MMTATAEVEPITHEGVGVAPEDQTRAGIYGLLARLFYGPPSAELLDGIRGANVIDGSRTDSKLTSCWCALQDAARAGDPAAIKQEYDDNFISTGRPPVLLYGSFYLAGSLGERPLAELRAELARLGLARKAAAGESEDHISALCDVMRFLIAGDEDTPAAALETQRDFFARHIKPWHVALCAAVVGAAGTHFYKDVARFAKEFFDLENESFEFAE